MYFSTLAMHLLSIIINSKMNITIEIIKVCNAIIKDRYIQIYSRLSCNHLSTLFPINTKKFTIERNKVQRVSAPLFTDWRKRSMFISLLFVCFDSLSSLRVDDVEPAYNRYNAKVKTLTTGWQSIYYIVCHSQSVCKL